jgi:hypothetical protein
MTLAPVRRFAEVRFDSLRSLSDRGARSLSDRRRARIPSVESTPPL